MTLTGKITVERIFEEYPKSYPSGIETSRRTARRLAGGIPRIGYEVTVATRIHNRHKQTMYLQNISGAAYRFWVYTDVCVYRGEN